jgi:hypothetical protein
MKKELLNEIYRIQEVMGINSKSIITESFGRLLDELAELLKSGIKKVPKEVEDEFIQYFVSRGKNTNEARDMTNAFFDEFSKTADESSKKRVISKYFTSRTTISELDEIVSAAIKKMDDVAKGQFFSTLLLKNVDEETYIVLEKIINNNIPINGQTFKGAKNAIKNWKNAKSAILSQNPNNKEVEEMIKLIDERYNKIELKVQNYEKNISRQLDPTTKVFNDLLDEISDDDITTQGQKLWNYYHSSKDPDAIKVKNYLDKTYQSGDEFLRYAENMWAKNSDELIKKVKEDLAKGILADKPWFSKAFDFICGTKPRFLKGQQVTDTQGNKWYSPKTRQITYETPDEIIFEYNAICNMVYNFAKLRLWIQLSILSVPAILYLWEDITDSLEKAYDDLQWELNDCLTNEQIDEYLKDTKNAPYINEGNFVKKDSEACNGKVQLYVKNIVLSGAEQKETWDNTWLRVAYDNEKFELKSSLSNEIDKLNELISNKVEDVKNTVVDTGQDIKQGVQDITNSETPVQEKPQEPAATEKRRSLKDRKLKQN